MKTVERGERGRPAPAVLSPEWRDAVRADTRKEIAGVRKLEKRREKLRTHVEKFAETAKYGFGHKFAEAFMEHPWIRAVCSGAGVGMSLWAISIATDVATKAIGWTALAISAVVLIISVVASVFYAIDHRHL